MSHLGRYLNNHLAGAVAALELVEHLRSAHAGTPLDPFFGKLYEDIQADRQELENLVQRLGEPRGMASKAAAWLTEKSAQLKLWMDDRRNGQLYLFEALEALALGIEGKRSLWQALALASATVPSLKGPDYERLQQRAAEQHQRVEGVRLQNVTQALTS
jgi:hypothetical protein